MFTDAAKPWASKASLDCKAGEGKHLLPAFAPVLEKIFKGTAEQSELKMLQAASSLEKLVSLWCGAESFLSTQQFNKSMALGKEFLVAYQWLNEWSLERAGIPLL